MLAYLRRIFNWHATRTDEFISPVVKGMGLIQRKKEYERSRVLTDDEIKKVWETTAKPGAFHSLVRFLLLTGCRLNEGAGLRWDEIDDAGIWTLPAIRNKSKVDLPRPLSEAALALVNDQPRLGDFVFSVSGRPLNSFGRYMKTFRENPGIAADWTLHDLRRSARSLLIEGGHQCRHCRALPRPRHQRRARHLLPPPLRARNGARLRGAQRVDRAHRQPDRQRDAAAAAALMVTAFKYTDQQWDAIAKHLRAGDNAQAVRKVLENAGLRYRLGASADESADRHLGQKRRQAWARRARRLLSEVEAWPDDEKHGLEGPLKLAAALIESDGLTLFEKTSNADKPAKREVGARVLHVWQQMLGRPIPKSGGNPSGPVARFLMAAANPILGPDRINAGAAARQMIRAYVQKRRA